MSIQVMNYYSIEDIVTIDNHQGERIKRLKTDHHCLGQTFHKPLRKISQTPNCIPNTSRANENAPPLHCFRLSNSEVTNTLFNNKKLFLVLDLDFTLLNSIPLDSLASDEQYVKNPEFLKGRNTLFRLDELGIITKLRPFVHRFLEEASKLFELCIFTMGDQTYALKMAKLLDPQNQYFKSRIFSQENCTKKDQKSLDVLNVPENFVVVLDDTEVVWRNHKENLILMDRYCYFASSCRDLGMKNCKSLSQRMRDEDEFDGALATILRVIKRIHSNFFGYPEFSTVRDVRQVLKAARKEVLKGCTIVFSGVFPRQVAAADQRLWKIAEEMGAKCLNTVDSCVTHVAAAYLETEKSNWAVVEGKFLVNPGWVEAAYVLWRRQMEDSFPVKLNQRTLGIEVKCKPNLDQVEKST